MFETRPFDARRWIVGFLVLLSVAAAAETAFPQDPEPVDDIRVLGVRFLAEDRVREIINRFTPGLAYTFDPNSRQLVYVDSDAAAGVPTILAALDVPERAAPGLRLTAHLLLGTRSGTTSPDFNPRLADVISDLGEALPYDGFTLLDTILIRAVPNESFAFSGILPRLPRTADELPYTINGRPRIHVTEDASSTLAIADFNFFVDIFFGSDGRNRRVGIDTAVEMRENEPVVVGRASFSDFSLVLVMEVAFDDGTD
jgi:hypothetical protein